jgi:hypothetical protein
VTGARVRLGAYGTTGTIEAYAVNGWPIVRWDYGAICRCEPSELVPIDEPAPAPVEEPDAGPEEAARILRELHAITSADLPLADLPFALQAQVSRGASRSARQGGLFDE